MYEYRPIRQNHVAHCVVLVLFMLAGGCFIVSGFMPKFPALLQSLGVLLLIPVIQIVARYLAVQYLYRVRELEDGSTDLEIFAYRGGTRMQLVCRVGLYEITATAPLGEQNRRHPQGVPRFSFSLDMLPKGALVLSVTNADGDCEILLCPDAQLTKILTAAPAEAVRPVYDPATGEDALPEDTE